MKTSEEMLQYCLDNKYIEVYNKKNILKFFDIIQKNLFKDEEVLIVFIGLHNYRSASKHDGNFAYAITNKRVLMSQKKLFGEIYQVVLLNNLNDITFQTGLVFGVITIDTMKETFNVAIRKAVAQDINDKLQGITYAVKNNTSKLQQVISQTQKSILEQLKALEDLFDMGILTDEEFTVQKNKILNRIRK